MDPLIERGPTKHNQHCFILYDNVTLEVQRSEQPMGKIETRTGQLSTDQLLILKALLHSPDTDYCYYYRYFEDRTGIARVMLEPNIKVLRLLDLVEYVNGLFGEDGPAGSGFMLKAGRYNDVKDLVENAEAQGHKLELQGGYDD